MSILAPKMYILAPKMSKLAPKMGKSLPFEKVQPKWQLFSESVWKSMGPINCLVTDIFQNIFFCVKQKKEIDADFEQL